MGDFYPVIPEDREAALSLRLHILSLQPGDYRYESACREYRCGDRDDWSDVQAFARHRAPQSATIAALEGEVARLREALRRYGNHSQSCAVRGEYVYIDARTRHRQACDCGYCAALASSTTDEGGEG